jgi:Na+-translocating ferredoxin:NAD+ oxidoreductase subunit C
MIPTQSAHGGLRLEAHKQRSTHDPIQLLSPPAEAVLALDQHSGSPSRPLVQVGDRVLKGQPIGGPDGEISAWLHAPLSGHIIAIEERPSATRGGKPALSVVIANDGQEERFPGNTSTESFRELAPLDLLDRIAQGGIVGLGGAVFPTAAKLATATGDGACTLLLNGAECEPYISCDEMLMRERAGDVVLGAQILAHVLGAREIVIGIEEDDSPIEGALREAIAAASDRSIRLVVVPDIYPAGGERQLIAAIFQQEVPFAGLPIDIGVVCQNVGTAGAIARWIRDGEPLISRIVTVTGDGVHAPRNIEARIGTPFLQLITACGGYTPRVHQLLMGGTMMGVALSDDSVCVVKGTNCLIAASMLDLQPRSPEMPCIRCGNCSEVCPARLLPQQLHLNALAMDLDGLERYGLMDCIECGCCDYVCPSQIPLVQRFRAAKPHLASHLIARTNAHDSRLRYEARNERLQRLEEEQRQKLEEKRRQAGVKPSSES